MRSLIAIFILTLAALPVRAETPVEAILAKTADGYVRPSYAALKTATDIFAASAKMLCETPNSTGLTAAQIAFKDTALAWSKVEWFRTGPVMRENRIERMFYFPDRKGLGLKQIQAALSAEDKSAASAETLANKSVAMQGLGASEFLLFGTGSETLATKQIGYRCTYVLASANTMAKIAEELETGWSDKSDASVFWQKPAVNNPFFRTNAEALNLMIGTLVHGLDAIRDMRLGNFIGKTPDADKPKMAAFWRSEITFASIAANLEGLQSFYETSQIQSVLPKGNDGLLRTIAFDFAQAIKAAKSLDQPAANVVADPDLRKKAAYLQLTVQTLIDHFNTEFAVAAGLDTGFSFGDGD